MIRITIHITDETNSKARKIQGKAITESQKNISLSNVFDVAMDLVDEDKIFKKLIEKGDDED